MNQNFSPEPKREKNQAKSHRNRNNINHQKALSNISKHPHPLEEKSTNLFLDFAETKEILNAGNAQIETEPKNEIIPQKPPKNFNVRLIAALASAVVMLPILAIGTASYYFGSQAINKQTALARRTDNTGISETELAKQRQLLANLLVGTGTTALLTGLIAAFLTNRTLRSTMALNRVAVKAKDEAKHSNQQSSLTTFINYLNQSADQDNILTATVEEAQRLLECDRVVVYHFDRNDYGKVIAEAVNPGWD